MSVFGRFRSLQRALGVLVGLAPIVALHTVAPGVVHRPLGLGSLALLDGPAVAAVLGIAYGVRRTLVMWIVMLVTVIGAVGLMAMVAAEDDGSLALIWWAPVYVVSFLIGFVVEAALDHSGAWRTGRSVVAILLGWWGLEGLVMVLDLQLNGPAFAREGIVSDLVVWAVVTLLALLIWPKRRKKVTQPV